MCGMLLLCNWVREREAATTEANGKGVLCALWRVGGVGMRDVQRGANRERASERANRVAVAVCVIRLIEARGGEL